MNAIHNQNAYSETHLPIPSFYSDARTTEKMPTIFSYTKTVLIYVFSEKDGGVYEVYMLDVETGSVNMVSKRIVALKNMNNEGLHGHPMQNNPSMMLKA